ncbi:MAG: SoxR reducing system RseC family protein [Firmicutes bacterium]|mgnify:CR=1 FL=1|jgi:sigma-E factor negative regulatory protein RseC|nr:SoxR reducing system RseC family protein [Bacillota bacterium]
MKAQGQFVEVLAQRPDACKSCGACKLAESGPHSVTAINRVGAVEGDWVELELDSAHMLRAVAIAYGIPLLAFITGLILGEPVARQLGLRIRPSLAAAIGGFLLLAIGYYFVHLYDRSLGAGAFMPSAVEIVSPEEFCPAGDRLSRLARQGTDGPEA